MLLLFRSLALHTAISAEELKRILQSVTSFGASSPYHGASHCSQLPACNNWIPSAGALNVLQHRHTGQKDKHLEPGTHLLEPESYWKLNAVNLLELDLSLNTDAGSCQVMGKKSRVRQDSSSQLYQKLETPSEPSKIKV